MFIVITYLNSTYLNSMNFGSASSIMCNTLPYKANFYTPPTPPCFTKWIFVPWHHNWVNSVSVRVTMVRLGHTWGCSLAVACLRLWFAWERGADGVCFITGFMIWTILRGGVQLRIYSCISDKASSCTVRWGLGHYIEWQRFQGSNGLSLL